MTSEPPVPPESAAGSQPSDPFAPPAAPPAPPPPPPPAAQDWSAPAPPPPAPANTGNAPFNPSAVNPLDWGILAAGFFALIFSFVSYYTVTAHFAGLSKSGGENAWHGFFGWFAALVALAAAGVLAAQIFQPAMRFPFPVRLAVLGGFALSLLCIILAAFITPGKASSASLKGTGVSADYGRGAGFWLSLIVILAGTVMSFLRLRESGGKLPWEHSKS